MMSFALAGTAAQSQPSHRFQVTGHVAPRCWAAAATFPDLTAVPGTAAARCSQGAMPLSIVMQPLAPAAPADFKQGPEEGFAPVDGKAIGIRVTPIL